MTSKSIRWDHRAEALARARLRAEKHRERTLKQESRFAIGRLMVTVVAIALMAASFESLSSSAKVASVIAFLGIILVATALHRNFKNQSRKWKLLEKSYELSAIRLRRDMAALRERETPWHKALSANIPSGHPYATDLDISTNVFTLFDGCATHDGSEGLLNEFLNAGLTPLSPEERAQRILRVRSLARHTEFLRRHETLRLDEEHISAYLHAKELTDVEKIQDPFSKLNLTLFSVAIISGVAGWSAMLIPALALWLHTHNTEKLFHALIAYSAIPLAGVFLFRPAIAFGLQLQQRTKVLELLLDTVENLRTHDSFAKLSCLQDSALRSFRRLRAAQDLISIRNNPVIWLISHIILPYDAIACTYLLLVARRIQNHLPLWEKEVIEVDIICSFARFLSENPQCNLFSDTTDQSSTGMDATGLAHPILKPETMVANNFSANDIRPLTLLTGSNMSGKSTFLRALGINQILFNMGAPVCATSFYSRPAKVLCAIRVEDSTSDGMSYFYAEVKRLKSMLDSLQECDTKGVPALFLVDEIFRGTNNRERYIGSWNVLHALLSSRAIGLVSTHDLALTELEAKDGRLRNMHFREHLENGTLAFDYRIKDGPCPTTNALIIMRSEGLPVSDIPPP
jgi:hypothetical protein